MWVFFPLAFETHSDEMMVRHEARVRQLIAICMCMLESVKNKWMHVDIQPSRCMHVCVCVHA